MKKLTSIVILVLSIVALLYLTSIHSNAYDWDATTSNNYLLTSLGGKGDIVDVVEYLTENEERLLTVPYKGLDKTCDDPDEHCSIGDGKGFNCTGFVAYTFKNCTTGTDLTKICNFKSNGWWANGTNWHTTASGGSGSASSYFKDKSYYKSYYKSNPSRTYKFSTIQELLNSNKYRKGDIIFCEPTQDTWLSGEYADCHIGFYWGDSTRKENKFFHSSSKPTRATQITAIIPKIAEKKCIYYIIKSAPSRITFNKNTTDHVDNMPGNGKKFMGASYVFPSNIPSRDGYKFLGWSEDKNATIGDHLPGSTWNTSNKNHTVYAIWESTSDVNDDSLIDYTIRFDSNGGTGTMNDIICDYDKDIALPKNTFKKSGSVFLGWSVNASDTNATYKDQSVVNNLATKDEKTVTLYAIWGQFPDIITRDIYIFENEKSKVDTEFLETESRLTTVENEDNITILEYHVTNIDDILSDLENNKTEITVKFDVTYNDSDHITTTAECKLIVQSLFYNSSRIRYIDDEKYLHELSIWNNEVQNQLLQNTFDIDPDDIDGYEVIK